MNPHDGLAQRVTEFLKQEPFSLATREKSGPFLDLINTLTSHHSERCEPYRHMTSKLFSTKTMPSTLEEVPYIPVRLFKLLELKSVPEDQVAKTMTSSGTTGQATSKIVLDRDTSMAQTRALTQIMSSILGKGRLPMVIIDSLSVVKDRAMFSARGAGIRGFSMFGRDVIYSLNDDMALRSPEMMDFAELHSSEKVFLFGFTSIIWQHMIEPLRKSKLTLHIPNGVLLHGGGWKKLESLSISTTTFNEAVREVLGVERVVNYYGMVEQTGSIFLECTHGHLHSSAYSEIVVRHPISLKPVPHGEEGLIQLISTLPMSYPGHSILTEDRGIIHGEDDCLCGWPGRYFSVLGRIKDAEIRGCSDTYSR